MIEENKQESLKDGVLAFEITPAAPKPKRKGKPKAEAKA